MKRLCTLLITLFALGDVCSQTLTKPQQKFLKKEAQHIQFEESFNNGNWESITKHIGDKRVVLLGEFNHETYEVFQIKNDLIKYLQENHGFNTILFESGIGELIIPDQRKETISPQQMTYGFFGYWRDQEFQELMAYVKQKDIDIAGFDVQRFGRSFSTVLADEARSLSIDSLLYFNIEERYGEVQDILTDRKSTYEDAVDVTNLLIADYENLQQKFPAKQDKNILLVKKTIENRIHYLSYRLTFLKDKDWNQRWIARDSMMAENVMWLMDNFYPNEKVIIYGHNFHIAKYNEKEEVMGEYLNAKMGKDMYSVGVFARSGSYRKDRMLAAPDSTRLDIKHVIGELKPRVNFLNISAKRTKGDHWLYEPMIVNDTFIDLSSTHEMDLSKHFDGLILLDKISTRKKKE